MNQAEYLGARLVMEIRRQADALAAWQASTDKINDLHDQIIAMSGAEAYASTGDIPLVPASGQMSAVRPVQSDRADGGHTYNLAAVAETLHLPAPVACPGPDACHEQRAHMHYADGRVVAMKEWTGGVPTR